MASLTRHLVAALSTGWLVGTGLALAAITPRISDEGDFFSPQAIERANQNIGAVYREYAKDVVVETVPRIPPHRHAKYKELGKSRFFQHWAAKRAEEAGVKGVYLFLCKSPGHLQIEVDRSTWKRGFTLEDRDRLVQRMLPLLKKKEQKSNDAALLLAVDTIESSLRANLPKQRAARGGLSQAGTLQATAKPEPAAGDLLHSASPTPDLGSGISPLGWVLIGLAVLAGIWLVSGLVRAISGGGVGEGGLGGGGVGGGFFSSLMAGMFGAAVGSRLCDTLLRGGGSHAFGHTPDSPVQPPGTEPGAGDFSHEPGEGSDFRDAGDMGGGDFGS